MSQGRASQPEAMQIKTCSLAVGSALHEELTIKYRAGLFFGFVEKFTL
jgi:hypothetical protein